MMKFFQNLSVFLGKKVHCEGPRELKKSVRARSPKHASKIQIFAFYYIFTLQFSKVSKGPGPHGPHAHEALFVVLSAYSKFLLLTASTVLVPCIFAVFSVFVYCYLF